MLIVFCLAYKWGNVVCGPKRAAEELRTDVKLHKARFTLVIKDVLSDSGEKNKQEEDFYESCKMEAELRVT